MLSQTRSHSGLKNPTQKGDLRTRVESVLLQLQPALSQCEGCAWAVPCDCPMYSAAHSSSFVSMALGHVCRWVWMVNSLSNNQLLDFESLFPSPNCCYFSTHVCSYLAMGYGSEPNNRKRVVHAPTIGLVQGHSYWIPTARGSPN